MTRTKKVFSAIAAVWLVGVVLTIVPEMVRGYREKTNFEKSLAEFGSAIQSGRMEQAYAMGGEDFKKATSYPEFGRQQGELQSKYGLLKAFRIDSYEVTIRSRASDWRATAIVTLEFERQTILFRFWMRNESNKWVLYGFRPE